MSNELERYLIHKATVMGHPIKATLELTPLCNMKCKMCYIHHSMEEVCRKGGLKPVSYWESLIPEMKEMGILFVALIGGEPFLYPDLRSVYEKLHENGFYINLTTNATLLSKKIPEWLKNNPPRYVTVSFYGASDRTYQVLTGNAKGFSEAMNGLKNLLNAGISVKLNYVVVKENKDDLEKIFRLKEKYNLPILATSYCFPQVRRSKTNVYDRFTPKECAREELEIMKLSQPRQYCNRIHYLAEEKYEMCTAKHTEHFYCHAGKSTFWITWQGNMSPCGMMNGILLNNLPGHLKKKWDILKRKTSKVHTSLKCSKCLKREVCQVCPAIMEAETGRTDEYPEYMCHITDEIIQLSKKENLNLIMTDNKKGI